MSSTQLQNKSFHVAERTRTSTKCQKMKNARAKRAKILFFIVNYANLCGFCCRRRRGCLSSLLSMFVRPEMGYVRAKIGLTGQFDRSQPGNYLQPCTVFTSSRACLVTEKFSCRTCILVSFAAVFRDITQRSPERSALRDMLKHAKDS